MECQINMADRLLENMSDRIADRIPDRISNHISDKVIEIMPNGMPDKYDR